MYLDKTKFVSFWNPIGMYYNALCTQTINFVLPEKYIYPSEIGKLEEHEGKPGRPVN